MRCRRCAENKSIDGRCGQGEKINENRMCKGRQVGSIKEELIEPVACIGMYAKNGIITACTAVHIEAR